ncbi:hypothetical protein KDN24_23275 [Bacillus sp. Bva_UNVM-123]|uniref:hypothetical protein n=1 Tax=Bacillus sp. Bva_UNVM-123 TaxID=2829798 RepID=UPI00391F54FD
MKKIRLTMFLLAILLITSGCMSEIKGQKITVQKMSDDGIFEDYREVTHRKQVQKAMEIVKQANWQNAKVEMIRPPDYQFQFPFKNSGETKIASYLLWVSPNGENLEIVTDTDKYVQLTKQDSANLYEILIGKHE